MKRLCKKCNQEKPESEFVFHKIKNKYENRCLSCKSAYTVIKNREIRHRNHDYIRKIKSTTSCVLCGNLYHFCQMDFNHIDPLTKKFEIWRVSTRSLKLLKEEINKCELLCANCHRSKTHEMFGTTKLDCSDRVRNYSNFINNLKNNKPCSDCHNVFPYFLLDFDHLNVKNFEMNRAKQLRINKEKVLKEISMCELVCVNCHRMRTYNRTRNSY